MRIHVFTNCIPVNKLVSWSRFPASKLVDQVNGNSCSILISGINASIVGEVAPVTLNKANTKCCKGDK